MTDEIKSKMVKCVFDDKGGFHFITPKGEIIPCTISSIVEDAHDDGGFKVVTLKFHAYISSK
jgi:hypothetical protein